MIIFVVLAYAVVVLFRKFAIIQKRRKERQLKESELINKLVYEGDLTTGNTAKGGQASPIAQLR
jgi:hypothetical protein